MRVKPCLDSKNGLEMPKFQGIYVMYKPYIRPFGGLLFVGRKWGISLFSSYHCLKVFDASRSPSWTFWISKKRPCFIVVLVHRFRFNDEINILGFGRVVSGKTDWSTDISSNLLLHWLIHSKGAPIYCTCEVLKRPQEIQVESAQSQTISMTSNTLSRLSKNRSGDHVLVPT